MRTIRYIVIHCTATVQTATIEAIQRYWREVRKWKNPGYHIVVKPDGSYYRLAPDATVCNGVAGHNSYSVHISYIGGIDSKGKALDNRTPEQKKTLLTLARTMRHKYPTAIIQGHRDFPGMRKDCPSFNAKKEYQNI